LREEDVREEIDHVENMAALRKRRMMLENFTMQDLGCSAVGNIYPSQDLGKDGSDLQKIINQTTRSVQARQTCAERKAKDYVAKVLSEGYYRYLQLRKKLGLPKESIRVSHWNQYKFNDYLSLINPGGLVWVAEGTMENVNAITKDVPISLQGTGSSTIIKPVANKYAFERLSDTMYDFMGEIANFKIDGEGISGSGGIKFDKVNHTSVRDIIIRTQSHGIDIGTCYNIHVHNGRISAIGSESCGIKVHPASGQVSADFMLDNTTIHDSPYGLAFLEGANGPWVTNVVVLGSSEIGILLEGVWCGGFFANVAADQCAGDGWVLRDTVNKYTITVLMRNCWASSCRHGMLIKGQYEDKGVIECNIDGYFGVNKLTGIRIEGWVEHVFIHDSFIRDNNQDNVSDINSTNLLIYNSPFFVNVKGCRLGWIYTSPTNRTYAARVWADNNAPRWTITRFTDCTIKDGFNPVHAKIGLKNTSSYILDFLFQHLYGIEVYPRTKAWLVESGSTSEVLIHDSEGWLSGQDLLPPAGVANDGKIGYLNQGGANKGQAFICMRKSDNTYEWVKFAETTV
jgi:hypothetical protein